MATKGLLKKAPNRAPKNDRTARRVPKTMSGRMLSDRAARDLLDWLRRERFRAQRSVNAHGLIKAVGRGGVKTVSFQKRAEISAV